MNKNEAIALLHSNIVNKNLRKHCYAVSAVMGALADHFGENRELWEITGLLHDLDYEKFPKEHPKVGIEILKKENYPKELIDAVAAHAWGFHEGMPEPKSNFEWSLYSCDELTGLIVAVTLVRPEKDITKVTVENVLGKWNSKSFAAGVDRKQIENCEDKLNIKLPDFIEIALSAMQEIREDLGL